MIKKVRGSLCVPLCAREAYPESKIECVSVCMYHCMNALHFNHHLIICIYLYYYYYYCYSNHSV